MRPERGVGEEAEEGGREVEWTGRTAATALGGHKTGEGAGASACEQVKK